MATSLNNYYPDADRSKNLYNIVIKGMKNTRTPQQKVVEIPEEAISETGIIDINLRDMKGNTRKLSELKGKAVIVDFTVYQSAVSATHNYMLRDLYDKYACPGIGNLSGFSGCRRALLENNCRQSALDLCARRQWNLFVYSGFL